MQKKKPTKSLNLVGFSTVCISTGGGRGTNTYFFYTYQILLKQSLTLIK